MSDGVGATSSPTSGATSATQDDRESRDLPPPPGRWDGGVAALALTGYLAPILGQVVATMAYPLLPARAGSSPAIPEVPAAALAIAVIVTFIVWALEFWLAAPMTSSLRAQPRFYTELIYRYQLVRDRWKRLGEERGEKKPLEVETQLDWPRRALISEDKSPGLRWGLAYGYVSVLRSLHFVEEELILHEDLEQVRRVIAYDELRLENSTLDTRDTLKDEIAAAKHALTHEAQQAKVAGANAAIPSAGQPVSSQLSAQEAREKLRAVHSTIDSFRDDARDGVIRARNQLLLVMFVVSAMTFLLFGLAEISGVPAVCLTTVTALYLVGAMVGCFNLLRIWARQSSAEEDFGLFQARLLATPLMSGLAAIGGVYLVAAMPALLPIEGVTRPVPALSTIFDLSSNSASLLYAAVFGLVPENLAKLLLGAADKLQTDLLASRPANSTAS